MPTDANLIVIFLTGLTTGGLTCLALQGGLLASTITKDKSNLSKQNHLFPVVSFLSTKLISHTILGFFLGLIGSAFTLSPNLRGWLQIAISLYLLGIAGNLLELHPIFRYFIITPPKFLSRLLKNESKSKSLFAPALLGFFTIFIPCAATQAVEVIALGTGNPLYAATIMFAFILGTSPTFLIFGFLLNSSQKIFQKYFPTVAATALSLMAIYSFNGGLSLLGSVYTLQNFYQAATQSSQSPSVLAVHNTNTGIQEVKLTVTNSGYSPQNITIKNGVKTKLIINSNNVQSCARAFTIPRLNIQKLLPATGTTTLEFTPTSTGPLVFSCSMGMYTGQFQVI